MLLQPIDPARLAGRCQGTGTFFKADLQNKVGSLDFVTEFKTDRSGTGRVGGATMQDVRVKSTRGHIEVSAKLTGAIGVDPALAKDRVVLLITALSDSTMQAEFHLKSNTFFDLRMREGRVVLMRVK